MLQAIKNILKHILPPPTRTLIRETESLRAEIHSSEQRHAAELESFRREQSELLRQLSTVQEQHFESIAQSFLHETETLRAELRTIEQTRTAEADALRTELRAAEQRYTTTSETLHSEVRAAEQRHTAESEALQSALRTVDQRCTAELEALRQEQAALIQNSLSAQNQQFDRIDTQLRTAVSSFEQKNTSLLQRINQNERTILSRFESEKWASRYFHNSRLKPEDYERELVLWYREHTGKQLDLQNPKTFNEKIQWMKLYDSTPLKTLLADKYLVRNWIKEKIGEEYLIPLLGVWDSFDEIDFDSLPNQFALKTTHGSGWNLIVNDKGSFNKDTARQKFTHWLSRNYAYFGLEMHYEGIPPKIIAEKFCPCQCEYQFWCFNGTPKFVAAILEPHGRNEKATYDLSWNRLEVVTSLPRLEQDVPIPTNFEDMLRIANLICADFPFVRVDFLHAGDTFFLGELTFTPANGMIKWQPPMYDCIFGDLLQLPPHSTIPNTD